MVIFFGLIYFVVGIFEVLSWEKRDLPMIVVYAVLMTVSLVFTVLLLMGVEIPVFSPIGALWGLISGLIGGGN